jgi:hypothetical protein
MSDYGYKIIAYMDGLSLKRANGSQCMCCYNHERFCTSECALFTVRSTNEPSKLCVSLGCANTHFSIFAKLDAIESTRLTEATR